jgi:hypothetical protein
MLTQSSYAEGLGHKCSNGKRWSFQKISHQWINPLIGSQTDGNFGGGTEMNEVGPWSDYCFGD